MTNTFPRVIKSNPLFTDFIGFDDLFDTIEQVANGVKNSKYPPYNIIKNVDNIIIEIAIAGFQKEDIEIFVEKDILYVTGKHEEKDVENYIYKGIAKRSFKHEFPLQKYFEVVNASINDGILKINLKNSIPEDQKKKIINIS